MRELNIIACSAALLLTGLIPYVAQASGVMVCDKACVQDINESFAQGKVRGKDTEEVGTFLVMRFTTMTGKLRTVAINSETSKMYVIQLSEIAPQKTNASLENNEISGFSAIKEMRFDRAFSVDDGRKHKKSDKDIYVFIDPNCPFCHSLLKAAKKRLIRGYSVHFIPVRVLEGTKKSEVAHAIEHDIDALISKDFKKDAYYETAEVDYNKSMYSAVSAISGKQGVPMIVSPSGHVYVGYSSPSKLRSFLKRSNQ